MTVSKPAIVVGIDGSPSAERAALWAAQEARLTRSPLQLIHAHAWGELSQSLDDVFAGGARKYLDRAREAARKAAPEVEVRTEILTQHPVEALTERSRSAERIVLGSRGLGGVSGLLVGSVAVGVSSHAACPVVVVRGDGAAPAGYPDSGGEAPVVVGVDTSAHSEPVLAFGFEYATLHRAPMVVVTTWADTVIDPSAMYLDVEAMTEDERCQLSERLAGWREKFPDVVVHTEVSRDRPAHALLEAAKAARLVVVGARGRGGMAGLLLGSTSQALIHRADCPVAVVRG